MQIGKWMPVLVIRLVAQVEVEQPVTCAIPMFLCDRHKQECEPQTLLTSTGRLRLSLLVAAKRRKKLNWDTLTVRWDSYEDAHKILGVDEATRQ